MDKLIPVTDTSSIFPQYRQTPIAQLLEYQNLNRALDTVTRAQMLVGMCMDNRKHLRIPDNFSYIIRTGGANLMYSEFKVSYAIAIGGVRHVALIAHNNCGMVRLMGKKEAFIQGLVEGAGWKREEAQEHFAGFAPLFEIGNEIDFICMEAKRLRMRYPKIMFAPLLYKVEDNLLYQLQEQ